MTDKAIASCDHYPSHKKGVLGRWALPFVLLLSFFFAACSSEVKFTDKTLEGPIVILGDSLAEGILVQENEGFVAVLSERLDREIVNLGKKGITTGESLPRVEKELLPLEPGLVIVELGGNDVLQKVDPAKTKENLQAIIDQVQKKEIPILLLGVRGGLMKDKLASVFEDLASENQLAYVPNILEGILTSPGLRVDNVHPNAKGHIKIADKVEPTLRAVLKSMGAE